MIALGKLPLDSTIPIPFTTNDGNGGSIGPSNDFETADFAIYKESLLDKKATTNGLSITSNGDSITGLHCLYIDTSDDTGDAGFWEAGANYFVVAKPDETVDSQTVVSILATFTLDPDPFDEGEGNEIIVFQDYGFVDEDGIIRIPIATSNSNGLATPDAIAVTIFKEDSTTEKTTANGITITTDFDSETGHHLIKIDTSDDTGDPGYWVTDKSYHVKIKTTVASAVSGNSHVNLAGVVFRIGMQNVNDASVSSNHNEPQFSWNLNSEDGDVLELAAWLDTNGQTVDIDALDATATCVITIREFSAAIGAPLLTFSLTANVATEYEDKRFQKSYTNPASPAAILTARKEYDIEVKITVNGTLYERNFSQCAW